MQKAVRKTIHEEFARFFEEPRRETLRELLKGHLGELRNCDFKEAWPSHPQLAKHLLGLGNSGGGCLIIGVQETADKSLSPAGLTTITDKADITNGIRKFIPDSLATEIEIADFAYDASEYPTLNGKRFQVLFVHPTPDQVPFVCRRDGEGIRSAAIYVRREANTEEANHDDIQRILGDRLAVSPRTQQAQSLKEHLDQLKVLYSEVPRHITGAPALFDLASIGMLNSLFVSKPNPQYPGESYDTFVGRLLKAKRALIEQLVEVK